MDLKAVPHKRLCQGLGSRFPSLEKMSDPFRDEDPLVTICPVH